MSSILTVGSPYLMKTAIILASYIPNRSKLWVGQEVLDQIKKCVTDDYTIFAGLNPSRNDTEWLRVLNTYTQYVEVTPEHLIINSDASAYQSALRAYEPHAGKFDLVIFLHLKGVTSGCHDVRRGHLHCLLGEYEITKDVLSKDDMAGSYGYTLLPVAKEGYAEGPIWDTLDRYCEWKYRPFKWFFACTLFAMKAHILDSFLGRANSAFLNERLGTVYKSQGDRYFFERDFGGIVSRSGYIMRYKRLINCVRGFTKKYGKIRGPELEVLYRSELSRWAKNNNIKLETPWI